jgi:hypothetical protein
MELHCLLQGWLYVTEFLLLFSMGVKFCLPHVTRRIYRLKVFENRMLRGVFGCRRETATGG